MSLKLSHWLSKSRRQAARAKQLAAVKVLMVCTANICRSPMAEGVFRQALERTGLIDAIFVDSAGTHAYAGAAPDLRAQAISERNGIDISRFRSRITEPHDLNDFDYVIAMDQSHYHNLLDLCETPQQREKIYLLMQFAPGYGESEVPDPYYGGTAGFERVMAMVAEATQGLLQHIREQHHLS